MNRAGRAAKTTPPTTRENLLQGVIIVDYQSIIEAQRRESLFDAIDQDSPDTATAERAKARISTAVAKLREYVAADAEEKAKAADKDWPTQRYSTTIPTDYKLPLALAEEVMDVLRELAGMGVAIRAIPDKLSVEKRYRQYLVDVCKAAWAEGVNRAPDPLAEYLRGNS